MTTLRETLTKEFLLENYIHLGLSIPKIAKLVGSCSAETVRAYLRRYDIQVKNKGREEGSTFYPQLTKEFLIEHYVNRDLSTVQIARVINCSSVTVLNKLREFNISIKGLRKRFKRGRKHPLWTGGSNLQTAIRTSGAYYKWVCTVLRRDNYICQECGSDSSRLEVHHTITFAELFREFLNEHNQFSPFEDEESLLELSSDWRPFWDLENGITLCKECHSEKGTYKGKCTIN